MIRFIRIQLSNNEIRVFGTARALSIAMLGLSTFGYRIWSVGKEIELKGTTAKQIEDELNRCLDE